MQVNRDTFGGQLAKRLPIPSLHNFAAVIDNKFPATNRYVWGRSRGQDRKISSEVLTRREFSVRWLRRPAKPREMMAIGSPGARLT